LAERKRIDEICLAFEDEWLTGHRPVVEAYVRLADASLRPVLLKELLLIDLDYRRSLREVPLPDDYQARFPEWSDSVCAAFAVAASQPVTARYLPGSLIGRYRVRKKLGAGAFASVYQAWDTHLLRDVAVKVPHPSRLGDETARRRFVSEARAVARLQHPRIVPVFDAAELEDGTVYLVMQFVAGSSLRQRMDSGPIPPAQACTWMAEVAEAVDAAHRAGVIHRDLKPSNILLDESLRPHVCDFGLALLEDQPEESNGERVGTLQYMPPEQLRGESLRLDPRADVWAAGVVLYEMLVGCLPFQGRDRAELTEGILNHDPRPLRQRDRSISRALERICLRCLEKRPGRRPATAGDLADDLRNLAAVPSSWRRPLVCGAVVLLLLLGGWWAAPALQSLRAAAAVGTLPLRGSINLFVWNPADARRQGVSLADSPTLPLREGDRVRMNVDLNRPAYVYIVWRDAAGSWSPVYPWHQGDWNGQSAHIIAHANLGLPEESGAGWPIRVPRAGMETLVLLARATPLPVDVPLDVLLGELPPTPLPPRAHAMWFQEGQLQSADHLGRTREPEVRRLVPIHDDLLQLQRQLVDKLQPHFELIRAVSFPVGAE
jgi:tRNA A-37 threonylcarbamoyl transferase component Bud32